MTVSPAIAELDRMGARASAQAQERLDMEEMLRARVTAELAGSKLAPALRLRVIPAEHLPLGIALIAFRFGDRFEQWHYPADNLLQPEVWISVRGWFEMVQHRLCPEDPCRWCEDREARRHERGAA